MQYRKPIVTPFVIPTLAVTQEAIQRQAEKTIVVQAPALKPIQKLKLKKVRPFIPKLKKARKKRVKDPFAEFWGEIRVYPVEEP